MCAIFYTSLFKVFYNLHLYVDIYVYITVVVTMKNSKVAEDAVTKLNKRMFAGGEVTVRLLPNNKLLCVAQLPLTLEERDFHSLVQPYGETERCFIMRTKTGIEFSSV